MKRKPRRLMRARAIKRAERLLLRRGRPRLLMTFVLLSTGSACFLSSFALLHTGMTRMWLCYPLALLFAYCVFLLLLRLWLRLQRPGEKGASFDVDLSGLNFESGGNLPGPPEFTFGGGGDAGGAGAGGGWGQSVSGTSYGGGGGKSGGSLFGGFDADFGDEGGLVVLAVLALALALVTGFVASFYVIYTAPVLLAEILVDGLLVAGLYKRLGGVEQRHWLRAATRKTLPPLILSLVCFGLAGYMMQRAVPEARTLGEFLRAITGGERPAPR